jgi:ABC-type antimicrobial peptide transport system permease subunit
VRFADVLRLSLSALWLQKVRTVLTVAGIAILALALTATVSVEEGFHREVERQLRYGDQLRQVWVFGDKVRLTGDTVAKLRALPHVESVAPMGSKVCDVCLTRDLPHPEDAAMSVGLAAAPRGQGPLGALVPLLPRDRQAIVFVARPNDEHLRDRIIAGRYLSSADANEVLVGKDLVHELALDRGQTPEWLVGQKLRIAFPSRFRSNMEMNRVLRLVDKVLPPSESRAIRKLVVRLREIGDRAILTAQERDAVEAILRRELDEPSVAVAGMDRAGPEKDPVAPGKEPAVPGKDAILTGRDEDERAVLAKFRKEIKAAREDLKVSDADRAALERVLRRYLGEPRVTGGGHPLFDEELVIVGVLRDYDDQDRNWGLHLAAETDNIDLFLSPATTERLYSQISEWKEVGYHGVFITVDDERNMGAVVAEVEKMGLEQKSLLEFVHEVQGGVELVTFLTSFLALLVWLAAALGITNIMLTSVLERTRDIGVMKAVGARDRHIQLVFLVEGGLLGVLGGALGVLGAWLASFPGDAYARRMMEQYAFGKHLTHSPFAYPWWLVLGVPLFTTLVTVLAAVLPARRAAKVDPIQALRHE